MDAVAPSFNLPPQISLDQLEFLQLNYGLQISDILSIPGYEDFLFSAETDKRAKPLTDEAQRALQLSQQPSYVPSELG